MLHGLSGTSNESHDFDENKLKILIVKTKPGHAKWNKWNNNSEPVHILFYSLITT